MESPFLTISMRFSNHAPSLFRQKFFSEREARAVMEKVRHGFFTKNSFPDKKKSLNLVLLISKRRDFFVKFVERKAFIDDFDDFELRWLGKIM